MLAMAEACGDVLKELKASNCQLAINTETMTAIANLPGQKLELLDVSYNKLLTDEGLAPFEGKTLPLTHLSFNGCTGITGKGLYHPIYAGRNSLLIYEGALMD